MSIRVVVLFLFLLGFWLLLSARLDPVFLVMGVGFSALVVWLTQPMVIRILGPELGGPRVFLRRLLRYSIYVAWLVSRIVPAGIQVAYYVLHPRLPIEPGVLRFRTSLRSPIARTILANSITLVPGTMTLEVDGDEFAVHALIPAAADDLTAATLQNRIADVFLEEHEEAPHVVWEPSAWRATS
jgi:multicomponent Na+:H+ antiporter subunit E